MKLPTVTFTTVSETNKNAEKRKPSKFQKLPFASSFSCLFFFHFVKSEEKERGAYEPRKTETSVHKNKPTGAS